MRIFGDRPPSWSTDGVCGVHMVVLRAEQAMRAELGKTSVADLARNVGGKAPPDFAAEVHAWLSNRVGLRAEARRAGVEQAKMVRATANGDGTA